MHRGGIADKVGNRFEVRWLTYQVLGLLDGKAQTVTVEALGDAGQGFEFSIKRETGTEWHQCKRQIVSATWSISNLHDAGVLAAFRAKISTDDDARCLFVSTDPSQQLKPLQDKLPATHSLNEFEASLSQQETRCWSLLKEKLGGEAAEAFRFLRQTEFRTLSEKDLTDILRERLSRWFKDEPDTVAALFRAWLEEDCNFNRPLCYNDVIAFVKNARIATKQYQLDSTLPERIRDATTSYTGSYPLLGAGQYRIERMAVREVLDGLQAGARVVLVSGVAGIGKSAVIADVINRLRDDGALHLALRVDQVGAVTTLSQLGEQTVGIADNPLVILEQLATNNRAVLIIDQADAVSEVSGRSAELRRVVLDLVRKAAHYPLVQLIFACRSFDLENDYAYREIAKAEGNVQVDVKPFERSEVDQVLTRLGILYNADNARLMALLALPIGLTLAAELAQSEIRDLRRFEHLSQLYGRLLHERDREIQSKFKPGWSIYTPLTALSVEMSDRQELVAQEATLDDYANAADILQRAGLIVVHDMRVGLIHESLFDHLYARAFVQKRKSLISFLLESEQTLFRRTQTRQILSFERELERERYLDDLGTILSDERVRPHIRETIVRWLATIPDPTPKEWKLVAHYARRDGLPFKADNVIFGRKPWFDLLLSQKVLDGWLASEGDDLNWALKFLRSVLSLAPTEISKLINSFFERRPDRLRDVFKILRFIDVNADTQPLADCLVAALRRAEPADWENGDDDWSDYYAPWVEVAPQEAAQIFGAQLERWFFLNPEGHPFNDCYGAVGRSMYWLGKLAKAGPLAFLEHLLPFMRVAMGRMVEGEALPANDSIWHWRFLGQADTHSCNLLDVVREALADVARADARAVIRLLRDMEPGAYITSLHLLLETVAENPEELRDLLVEQLGNPGLFKAGWHNADAYSAGRAIAATMPWLTVSERNSAEAAILALQPEIEYARRALAREASGMNEAQSQPETKGYATPCLNKSGKRQWSVLRQIGAEHLSPRAAKRFAELDRKFSGQKPDQPDDICIREVGSPIDGERTRFMNDAAWLEAIAKFSTPDKQEIWDEDGLRGGAMQLSRELQERTKEAPERFLKLLARFPAATHQHFVCGITDGIAGTKPDTDMIERVLETADSNPAARADNRSLIWMIGACRGTLGSRAEALLLTVAVSDDDSTGMGDITHRERDKQPDWKRAFSLGRSLTGKAINSARGSALDMLGKICWGSREAFDKYRSEIDTIIGVPAAAHVQSALGGLLMSALKHEGKQGVDWVLRTARACPEALYTKNGQQIVWWLADLDPDSFKQLIDLYFGKGDPLALGFVALAIFHKSLNDPEWLPWAEKLIETNAEYRSAAAAVAVAYFKSTHFSTTCTDWLIRLFDDEEEIVRREARDCFRQMETSDIAVHAGLFEAYAKSRYFESDERTYFLKQLEDAPPELDELVFKLLEYTLKAQTESRPDPYAYQLHEIGPLVLRLYASNIEHPQRRSRSLDLIDSLVERGLMEMQKLEAI